MLILDPTDQVIFITTLQNNVNLEIFTGILFLRIAFKDIFAT